MDGVNGTEFVTGPLRHQCILELTKIAKNYIIAFNNLYKV